MKWFLFTFLFLLATAQAEEIRLITHKRMPPYTFIEDGKQVGILPDLVTEIYRRAKKGKPKFITLPWARAVNIAGKQARSIIFPLTRTEVREPHFLWIGPSANATLTFALIHRKGDVLPKNIYDLKNKRIGVLRGAPTEARLKKLKFAHIKPVEREEQNLKTLLRGHIDAWYSSDPILSYNIAKKKVSKTQLKLHYLKDRKYQVYIAASKDLKEEVKTWNKILKEIKRDGTHQKIIDKYLKQPN